MPVVAPPTGISELGAGLRIGGRRTQGSGYCGGCSKETREADGQVLDGDLGWTIESFLQTTELTRLPPPQSWGSGWSHKDNVGRTLFRGRQAPYAQRICVASASRFCASVSQSV